MLFSLPAERDVQPEIMDQPGLDPAEHVKALGALRRINWLSRSARILWRPIAAQAAQRPGRRLRVLDIASGGGDVLVCLANRARKSGLNLDFTGADISPTALDCAQSASARAGVAINFKALDVLHEPIPDDFDIITCSLFLHHLKTEAARDLLRRMGQAARAMVLVNDLVRSRVGYGLAWVVTRLLTTSYVVHGDGPSSVSAAFTIGEVHKLADEAGLLGAKISWRYPC